MLYSEYEPRKRTKMERALDKLESSGISAKKIEEFVMQASGNETTRLFSVPPCEIQEAQFKKRYGLIKFIHEMPAFDRFRVIEIPDETLRVINSFVANDLLYSKEFQGSSGLETQEAPILDRLVRNLGRFTRPRPPQEEEVTYENQQLSGKKKADLAVKVAAPVHVDPEAVVDEEELVGPYNSSDAFSRQHSDLKLLVYKRHHALKGLRLKVVTDWKTLAGVKNLLQPAIYAIDELLETAELGKEYRPPVYLTAQDRHTWFYAILEIDGYIQVDKKGEIVPSTLEGFPEVSGTVNPNKFTPTFTRSQVATEFLRWKCRMEREGMYIPAGLHPVGRLFMRPVQRYKIPNESVELPGQKRFYDGLLKILVGRRVTKWSPEDALKAWNARKFLEEKNLAISGVPERLWPMFLSL